MPSDRRHRLQIVEKVQNCTRPHAAQRMESMPISEFMKCSFGVRRTGVPSRSPAWPPREIDRQDVAHDLGWERLGAGRELNAVPQRYGRSPRAFNPLRGRSVDARRGYAGRESVRTDKAKLRVVRVGWKLSYAEKNGNWHLLGNGSTSDRVLYLAPRARLTTDFWGTCPRRRLERSRWRGGHCLGVQL